MRHLPILALSALSLVLAGCGGGGSSSSTPTTPSPPGPLTLVVADGHPNASIGIWRPDGAAVDGDVSPDAELTGAMTQFAEVFGIHIDSRTNTLIVGDVGPNPSSARSAIWFFAGLQTLDGNTAPTRTLEGAATLLGQNTYDVFVDETRDLLYVANDTGILVYANAGTVDGNVAPARHITGPDTQLQGTDADRRLFVDAANDRLYILVAANQALYVWDNASTINGNVAPHRTLAGASTGFMYPWGMVVDVGRDLLYISDESADAIFIYDNASTVNGNVAPTRTISGATSTVRSPSGIDLDPVLDRLYVSNHIAGPDSSCAIWDNASTRDGDTAPTRTVTGANTNIDGTGDIALTR